MQNNRSGISSGSHKSWPRNPDYLPWTYVESLHNVIKRGWGFPQIRTSGISRISRLRSPNASEGLLFPSLRPVHRGNFSPMEHCEIVFHVCERTWKFHNETVPCNKNFAWNKFRPKAFCFMFHETPWLPLDYTNVAPAKCAISKCPWFMSETISSCVSAQHKIISWNLHFRNKNFAATLFQCNFVYLSMNPFFAFKPKFPKTPKRGKFKNAIFAHDYFAWFLCKSCSPAH